MSQFKHLFSPIQIGSMTVRNRIVCTSHETMYTEPHTFLPTDRLTGYYVGKAKGGVGLIFTHALACHESSHFNVLAHPQAPARFKKTADAIHEHGARFIGQIFHYGGETFLQGASPWAPSVFLAPNDWKPSHEMTIEEIHSVRDGFVQAARVLQDAGLDGVEIHAAHGYLLTEFMNKFHNQRQDEYGGSLENRLRLVIEITDAVREAVGKSFVVGMRINGDDFLEGANTLDDMKVIAPMLTAKGNLDYISVAAGTHRHPNIAVEPMYFPLSSLIYLAAAIKEVVNIPVIGRGRVNDPVQAEDLLASNQLDLVGMTRPSIADPEFPNKAREGRLDEIRKCLACNEGCFGRVGGVPPATLGCVMNTGVGRETEPGWSTPLPAVKKKRIMVIGGGPAGLETARQAAARGHNVSLYEKGPELGGLTVVAARAPGREGFLDLQRYQTYQMKLLGVNVHLNTEATLDTVKAEKPDAVVVATGSIPIIPNIPGADQPNVTEVRAVLSGKVETGQNVLIIAGEQHIEALSTADYLASQGKTVHVVTEEHFAGSKIEPSTMTSLYQRLYQNHVNLVPNTAVKEISGNTVIGANVFTREETRFDNIDTVVVAFSGRENSSLHTRLKGMVKELYAVGDCAGVRRLFAATRDAGNLGRKI